MPCLFSLLFLTRRLPRPGLLSTDIANAKKACTAWLWTTHILEAAKTEATETCLGDAHLWKTNEKMSTVFCWPQHSASPWCSRAALFHPPKIFSQLSHISPKRSRKLTIPGNFCFLLFVSLLFFKLEVARNKVPSLEHMCATFERTCTFNSLPV